jgi:uncharacterized protein YjbI with pentapeptide repeats
VSLCLVFTLVSSATADIFRWDNGRIIPGTAGIVPRPGVLLDFKELSFADLSDHNLQGASFRNANLSGADLSRSRLAGSDLTRVNLSNAKLAGTDLAFSVLDFAELRDANFLGASFSGTSMVRASLAGSDLSGATISSSDLTGADFTGATIAGATFLDNVAFTTAQLYSTASYQSGELAGIALHNPANLVFAGHDLTGAAFAGNLENIDFSGANLTNATFSPRSATWHNVDLSAADLRGAQGVQAGGRNAILDDGQVLGLALLESDAFVLRDYDGDPARSMAPMPIKVQQELTLEQGSLLRMEFDKDPWDSMITFTPGIPVALGGTLELDFSPQVNATPQVGRSIKLFDWSGVEPLGDLEVTSQYIWDMSSLYTTGEVRLTGAGIRGDYNANQVVDQGDLNLVLQNWGSDAAVLPIRWVNDLPIGAIDQEELDLVLVHWGRTTLAPTGVPEPTSLALLCCASLAIWAHRRHRLVHRHFRLPAERSNSFIQATSARVRDGRSRA